MLRYVVRRLLQSIVVVFGVSIVAFGMTFLTGDPTEVILGDRADQMSTEDIQAFRVRMGFDRPWYVQYVDFVTNALQGDFGYSFIRHKPAYEVITERLPATIQLASVAFVISIVFSIPLGVLSATRAHTPVDYAVTVMALVGQSIPSFWLGILLILLFGVQLRWLPISGSDTWANFVLPAIALGYYAAPAIMRLTRAGMIEVLDADYIRTARAKGLAPMSVVFKHALRNAVIPVVALAAVQLGFVLGGSVVIETVFALHGLGYLAWESILQNDFPVVQAIVMLIAVIYVLLTLVADLANAWLDPRIRIAAA
jgi:peptide/nickel transport system permease protein